MSKSESALLATIWTLSDFITYPKNGPMHSNNFLTKYLEKLQVLLQNEALIIKIDFKIKNWNW